MPEVSCIFNEQKHTQNNMRSHRILLISCPYPEARKVIKCHDPDNDGELKLAMQQATKHDGIRTQHGCIQHL